MAQHRASGGKIAALTQWAAAALAAVLVFGIGCIAGYQAQDSFGQAPFWIVYGGNLDPGDGQGNGVLRDQLVAGGWVSYENSFQIPWKADIGQGLTQITNEAMGAGHHAYQTFCGSGCVIAGFSLGTAPALQLAAETGTAPSMTYIFGGPQPSTGIFHQPYVQPPFVKPFVELFGRLDADQHVPPGTQVFYDTRDIYANSAPSCAGPGWFLLFDLAFHRVVSRGEADSSHIWTGPDGAVMHEVGYQAAPFGLPRSGSDENQFWDFCPPESLTQLPSFPAMNGDPGVPALPGIPAR